MPSSYTARYKLELPATNDLVGTWGAQVNTAITQLLDDALDAVSSIAMADANQTLTIPNGTTSPNRAGTLVLTGALTGNRTLTVPSGDRVLRVVNATSGGFNVLVKNPSSGTVTVSPGYMSLIYFQGAVATQPGYQMPSATIVSAVLGSAVVGFADGAAATPSVTFTADTNTGLYRVAADQIGVTTGGVLRMSVSSAAVSTAVDLTVNKTTPNISLDTPAASSRSISAMTGGVNRFVFLLGTGAESGANAGSNLSASRYDDAGVSLGAFWSVTRSTGEWGIGGGTQSGTQLAVRTAGSAVSEHGISVINSSTANDATTDIRFQTGSVVTRARVRGQKEGATNAGSIILSTYVTTTETDALTITSALAATFAGTVTGVSFTPTSDARLKHGIETISHALDRLCELDGVTFFKDGAKRRDGGLLRQGGVIAQAVEGVMPEAVVETDTHLPGRNVLAVDPMALIGLLIEAVKELRAEVRSSLNRKD